MRFRVIGGYGWWPVPNSGQNINSAPALEPLSVQTLFDACFFGTATPAQAALLAKSDMSRDLRSFMHKHQVGAVVVLPVGNYPSIVTSALTGAIGPPSHVGGATVWFHVQQRLETTRMEASPLLRTFLKAPPETNVVKPAGDAQLGGVQFLDASASSKLGVRSVQFRIAGEGRTISERGVPSPYGWITEWNTRSVPDGTYTVSSVARGNTGLVTTSTGVVIRVKN
jgi:hypothetical protein